MEDFLDISHASEEEILLFLQRRQREFAAVPAALNRRETARMDVVHTMTFQVNGAQIRRPTRDISASGAKVVGVCPGAIQARLAIGLNNHHQWGAAMARVVRVDTDSFGIQFLFKTAEFDAILKDLVRPKSIG